MRGILIVVLFVGIFITISTSYYLINGYLMYKNGIKINGCVKEKKVINNFKGGTKYRYSIVCMYKDSIYVSKFNLIESKYNIGDSIIYYFNPNNTNELIYTKDHHFRRGNYISFFLGFFLILLSAFLNYKFQGE